MNAARTMDAPLTTNFSRRTRLTALLACLLVFAVLLQACAGVLTFGIIGIVSQILGLLNSMGVFGDGAFSDFIGKLSTIGTIVGLGGGLMWGFNSGLGMTMGEGAGFSMKFHNAGGGLMHGFENGFEWGGREPFESGVAGANRPTVVPPTTSASTHANNLDAGGGKIVRAGQPKIDTWGRRLDSQGRVMYDEAGRPMRGS